MTRFSRPLTQLTSGLALMLTAVSVHAMPLNIDELLAREIRASTIDGTPPGGGPTVLTVGGPGDGCDYTNLQTAINAIPPLNITNIRLANTGNYLGGTYVIQDRLLRITGGYESCSSSEPTGQTTLNANGNGRVFHVLGSTSTTARAILENLIITNGSGDNEGGGGIRIEGRPGRITVQLINTTLSNNSSATHGGGIKVVGIGEEDPNGLYPTMLDLSTQAEDNNSLDGQVIITQNSAAFDGGGIACRKNPDSAGLVTVRLDRGVLLNNSAGRDGGGLFSDGCSLRFYQGSPIGVSGIFGNQAERNGGGLALKRGFSYLGGGVLAGYGYAGYAMLVRNNSAGVAGGGLHIEDANVQTQGLVIEGNQANQGAGLAAIAGAGFSMLGEPTHSCAEPSSGLAGFPLCNRIQNNATVLGDNGLAPNGGAWSAVNSFLAIDHAIIADNRIPLTSGGQPRLQPSVGHHRSSSVSLRNSLVTGNQNSIPLFRSTTSGSLDLRWSTIAGNQDIEHVIHFDSAAELHAYIGGSIIHQPGSRIFEVWTAVTGSRQMRCVIGSEPENELDITTLAFYSQIDPEFLDPDSGDFRLGPSSPAIDYCDDYDIDSVTEVDFSHRPRGLPYPDPITLAPNRIPDGIYDLGAWERETDRLFRDRFEN